MAVKATKNGITREFDERLWNNMPEDKYGWVRAAETPEVLKPAQPAPATETKAPAKKAE